MTFSELNSLHNLYLVATPIGNLEDITLRALRILREAGLIAAEDTRTTGNLLKHFEIDTPLVSFFEHSRALCEDYILAQLEHCSVALVSEAGMPGISDPGYELVVKAIEKGIRVIPVPGASAVIAAMAASGLPSDRFCYLGFLPRKKAERRRLLLSVIHEPGSIVLFEAPHRLISSLNDIIAVLGDRQITVAREITKVYEEFFRGRASEAVKHFVSPRGEFTLVVSGGRATGNLEITPEIAGYIKELKQTGIKARDGVNQVAVETGLNRRNVYRVWLES